METIQKKPESRNSFKRLSNQLNSDGDICTFSTTLDGIEIYMAGSRQLQRGLQQKKALAVTALAERHVVR